MLDQETTQALEAAAERADEMAGAVNAKPAKKRNVNHAAKCRKAWDAFQAAAKAASDAGVDVVLRLGEGEDSDAKATDFSAVITASY